MAEQGWIKLHRQIRESDLWREKPFSRAQAWIDLLLEANHKDKNAFLGSEVIPVQRGSFITSIRKLCDRWGWSNTKVKRFLKCLESDQMIAQKNDTKKTVITIVNYGVYQSEDIEKTTQKRHKNDAEASQKHTTKNVKNVKNEKNDKKVIYGERVRLTPEEHQKLIDLYGEFATKDMIAILDNWYLTKGKPQNKSDYHTMVGKGWVLERYKQDKARKQSRPKATTPQQLTNSPDKYNDLGKYYV